MEEKTSKKEHYDKRLILEIVKQAEEGVPRKLLREKYGLGQVTLGDWLKKYGSEFYQLNKRKAYSNKDKQYIVAAITQGRMTIKEACAAYQIRSEKSVREWVSRFKKEKHSFTLAIPTDMAKKKKAAVVKSCTSDLQKALEEAQLKIIALNTMIDVAEEQLKIDIRKKSGAKPSLD
jgi:transposase